MVGSDHDAFAQVVQLPSTHTFGYTGAVTVPDSGQAYLGGVGRQRTGSTRLGSGPMSGRAIGSQTGGGAMSMSATIIDLQAMDAAIMNEPAATAAKRPSNYAPRFAGTPIMNTLTPHLYARRMGADQLAPPNDPNAWEIALGNSGAAEIGRASAALNDDSDVRFFMLKAKEAHNAGRPAAALVYYRLAYQRLSPEQQARLQEFQAEANAEAKAAQAFAAGTPTVGTAPKAAAASDAAAGGPASASSAASSPAGEVPSTENENANPFDSPF